MIFKRCSLAAMLAVAFMGLAGPSFAADTAGPGLRMAGRIQVGPDRGGKGDPVVYDSTGADFTTTGSTPRTFIGGAANIDGTGPQVDITSIDLYMAATTAVSYTNVRARIQFWDTYNAASSPVYSAAAGTVIEADIGPITTTANTVSTLTIDLPAPLRLNSLSGKGFAVNFQGDTGAGLVNIDALTTPLSVNGPQNVGSSAAGTGGNGFYRNVSGQTTFNFVPSDLRTFTGITDARASLTLRGNSSVPVSLQSFSID